MPGAPPTCSHRSFGLPPPLSQRGRVQSLDPAARVSKKVFLVGFTGLVQATDTSKKWGEMFKKKKWILRQQKVIKSMRTRRDKTLREMGADDGRPVLPARRGVTRGEADRPSGLAQVLEFPGSGTRSLAVSASSSWGAPPPRREDARRPRATVHVEETQNNGPSCVSRGVHGRKSPNVRRPGNGWADRGTRERTD